MTIQPQAEQEEIIQEDAPEQEIVQEAAPEPEPQAEVQPEPEFDPRQKVEFDKPEQQKKFNDVYKQMKMSDSRNRFLNDSLSKAMEKIDELEKRFNQTDHAEAERVLNSRLKEARDAGDEDKADKILQEIIDFRVESKLQPKKPDPKVENALADPDVRTVVTMAQEVDERGQLKRPWIDQTHPDHANAMRLAGAVALQVHADLGYTDVGEVFRRMDEGMKPKAAAPVRRAIDPMRGNLTNKPPQGKMKLSPAELAAAEKLGVKPEAYLKWK
jgi:hypothetical protein